MRNVGAFLLCIIFFSCSNKESNFESNRLEKEVLCETLEDPVELAVAKAGRVFIIERRGTIKLYRPDKKIAKTSGKIQVELGHEDGLVGLALDPNFESNVFLFLLYTPSPYKIQKVARFRFDGNKIDVASESIVLEYPIVPERHQGGS